MPERLGPTEAVAEALCSFDGVDVAEKYGCHRCEGFFWVEEFLVALKARGYIVTREYQE